MRSMGTHLRALRERAGLSLAEAARAIGLSPSALRHIEGGRAPLSWPRARRLASVLGIPITQLLTRGTDRQGGRFEATDRPPVGGSE